MPGFIVLGNEPQDNNANAKAEFRRKHRWRVQAGPVLDAQEWTYLQKAQRPHYKLEEPVVHHNEEQAYFAGKRSWEPCALTFYDRAKSSGDISETLWNWIAGGTDGGSVTDVKGVTTGTPDTYKLNLILQMLQGTGEKDETWTLYNAWAKEVNWNDLDYTNTEIQLINVTVRFDRAIRE